MHLCYYYVIISLCSSLGKGGTLHLEKQQDFPSARDDLRQVWLNWLGDSGEINFLVLSMYFHYFVIISPWKRAGPFIWTNLNPFTQGCFLPSLVVIGKKKMNMWKVYDNDDGQQTNFDQKSPLSLRLRWAKKTGSKTQN